MIFPCKQLVWSVASDSLNMSEYVATCKYSWQYSTSSTCWFEFLLNQRPDQSYIYHIFVAGLNQYQDLVGH